MLVDHEAVLLALKGELVKKHSHGQRELLTTIARLEAHYRLEEGLPEMALRLYGAELTDALRHGPATGSPAGTPGDGSGAHSLSDPHPKEPSDGSRYAVTA